MNSLKEMAGLRSVHFRKDEEKKRKNDVYGAEQFIL